MAPSGEHRLKRLIFRSWHRGTREMDLMLGRFAEAHLHRLRSDQVERYEALLTVSDPDIYDWLSRRETVPPEHDTDVLELIREFNFR